MKCLIVVVFAVALATSAAAVSVSNSLDCSTPCKPHQCKATTCVTGDPFACVEGSAKGGCATSAVWFSNTSSCTSCCDVSGCAITCAPCSASECAASVCTAKDPFVCTGGQDAKGCAPSANDWKINPGCSSCCDLASCPTPPPTPKPTPAPAVVLNCNKSCGDLCKNPKTCGVSAPFMCTAGNASFGCLKTDAWSGPACTDCCDVSMCPKTNCGACSAATCKNTQCNYLNPFICTKGTLDGGCSSSKSFWPSSPDCDKCCDLSKC